MGVILLNALQEVASYRITLPSLILQSKVTAINGRPAGDQYLPNYLSISSWYSPSKCHIQLLSPSAPLMVKIGPY